MHNRSIWLLNMLWLVSMGRAEPIHYDQIPADVAGYVHIDIDRLIASNFVRQAYADRNGGSADVAAEFRRLLGARFSSVTAYSVSGPEQRAALFVGIPDPADAKRIEANAAADKDAIVFQIGDQKVYFTSAGLGILIPRMPPADVPEPEMPSEKQHNSFSLSLGIDSANGAKINGLAWDPTRGPSYMAFVGPTLVIASDLRTIASAMDVMHAKKPSLAQQDPQGFRLEAQPGTIIVGAGLTASFRQEDLHNPAAPGSTTRESTVQNGAVSFDLFNPFRGKARLARFEMSEDEQSEHIRASLSMTDPESAEQLKNLAFGVKALLFLSNEKARPFVAPLDVQAAGKDVTLHWSYPTAKLIELIHSTSEPKNDHTKPTTAPASAAR